MNIEQLIHDVVQIQDKHRLMKQKTGGYFNIFTITNIATNEVAICRILYELLNPKGSHYQGGVYLALFVEHVLNMNIPVSELQQAAVYREYVIANNRRVDLVITTPHYVIPIEVKIFAGDQENQCADYVKIAQHANVYYLTRFGDAPSKVSSQEEKCITTISFAQHIVHWLLQCVTYSQTMKLASICEILRQLLGAIRQFTEQVEDEQEMDIQQVLTASATTMKSAYRIEQGVKKAKINLLHRLFKELEQRIQCEKLNNDYDYAQKQYRKLDTYYDVKNSTYPGISYLYKKDIQSGVDIWFRIELDGRLYAGFVVAVNGRDGKQVLSETEIKGYLPHIEQACIDNWWAYWELLPDANEAQIPNFKYPNEEDFYFELFEETTFQTFIEQIMERVYQLFPEGRSE
ncbi:PDDEXK-like family protein [Lysinibacillus piscis]|uniref:PD-(D/E)XK nuclease superfamily protein n=1 Tax=Lysinibacillus piscis TaxID=2518931 RepID=A0ABQ5NLG8_9BACI|nr:PD-(D/E)XK nuclease family protein [Lysinibacillus sp. KH24]GLC89200.1 hypothetical protein LYSBPC_23270 [Lysinibacillus sp. KH24]